MCMFVLTLTHVRNSKLLLTGRFPLVCGERNTELLVSRVLTTQTSCTQPFRAIREWGLPQNQSGFLHSESLPRIPHSFVLVEQFLSVGGGSNVHGGRSSREHKACVTALGFGALSETRIKRAILRLLDACDECDCRSLNRRTCPRNPAADALSLHCVGLLR